VRLRLAVLIALGFVLTGAALEGLARLAAPEQLRNSCQAPGNHRKFYKPSCVSRPMKMAESPWMTYATNACGARTAESCTAKAADQLRVAVIGTSLSYGLWVPYPETWAARTTQALKNRCRRPVDIQNLAFSLSQDGDVPLWHDIVDTAAPALALKPDALVTILGPTDLGFYKQVPKSFEPVETAPKPKAPAKKSLRQRLIDIKLAIYQMRSISVFRQWWQGDQDRYLQFYAEQKDTADFLRQPPSKPWRDRLTVADDAFARIAAAANAAHVPWIVLLSPTYGQAALAAGAPKPGLDPYLLGNELRPMIEGRGGVFYDLTGDFAAEKRLAPDYYVVNGHPNGRGEAVIARRVATLLAARVPAFSACGQP